MAIAAFVLANLTEVRESIARASSFTRHESLRPVAAAWLQRLAGKDSVTPHCPVCKKLIPSAPDVPQGGCMEGLCTLHKRRLPAVSGTGAARAGSVCQEPLVGYTSNRRLRSHNRSHRDSRRALCSDALHSKAEQLGIPS